MDPSLTQSFDASNWATIVSWIIAGLFCFKGFWLYVLGQGRYYDPLKALVFMEAAKNTGYTALRIVFGSDGPMSPIEMMCRLLLGVLSVLIATTFVYVVFGYARSRA